MTVDGQSSPSNRLEDWYSLLQSRQPSQGIRGVHFTDVMGLELPSLLPSVLTGNVEDVSLENTVLAGALAKIDSDLPPEVRDGAAQDLEYSWTFGDGSHATGRKVRHKLPDTNGTLWDGSGYFRVLLHVSSALGRNTWILNGTPSPSRAT